MKYLAVLFLSIMVSLGAIVPASAVQAPPGYGKHELYNVPGSNRYISGYEGVNCTGPRVLVRPGTMVYNKRSYKSWTTSRVKVGKNGTWYQIKYEVCFTNLGYDRTYVFAYRGRV